MKAYLYILKCLKYLVIEIQIDKNHKTKLERPGLTILARSRLFSWLDQPKINRHYMVASISNKDYHQVQTATSSCNNSCTCLYAVTQKERLEKLKSLLHVVIWSFCWYQTSLSYRTHTRCQYKQTYASVMSGLHNRKERGSLLMTKAIVLRKPGCNSKICLYMYS